MTLLRFKRYPNELPYCPYCKGKVRRSKLTGSYVCNNCNVYVEEDEIKKR